MSDFEFGDLGDFELMHAASVVEAMHAAGRSVRLDRGRSAAAREQALDAALEDSFPASDPPAWTLGSRLR